MNRIACCIFRAITHDVTRNTMLMSSGVTVLYHGACQPASSRWRKNADRSDLGGLVGRPLTITSMHSTIAGHCWRGRYGGGLSEHEQEITQETETPARPAEYIPEFDQQVDVRRSGGIWCLAAGGVSSEQWSVSSIQQHNMAGASRCQVIRCTGAHYSSTDDDDICCLRKHYVTSPPVS